jgi:hypothetical protein
VRHGLVGEQALTEGQESGAPAIGQEAERADADKAARQDVEQEAAQELLRTAARPRCVTNLVISQPLKKLPDDDYLERQLCFSRFLIQLVGDFSG